MKPLCVALVPILLLSIPSAAQKPSSRHFDLKGETLGESLEAFKKAHPDAQCSTTGTEWRAQLGEYVCMVYRAVSFAGLPASSDDDCDHIESKVGDGHNCWEGLNASIRSGKPSTLSYIVQAEGGRERALSQVVSALTDKYGKPEHVATNAPWSWFTDKEVLMVYANELPVGQDGENVTTVNIELDTQENQAKQKDI